MGHDHRFKPVFHWQDQTLPALVRDRIFDFARRSLDKLIKPTAEQIAARKADILAQLDRDYPSPPPRTFLARQAREPHAFVTIATEGPEEIMVYEGSDGAQAVQAAIKHTDGEMNAHVYDRRGRCVYPLEVAAL